ncbi:unnamed protein product [Linum tenue]|uniref:F-box domain-containing protein n=1 Tax=Linum tenue TaxID=586396 RepID=A0AAV0PVE3_9ROSI|nr:unnamed protein product [Linum tenue]
MTESETENFSSNLHLPSSSICVPSAQRPIWPQGNPPPLNLFSKLANDLLIEILIRLPNPRSSCRCKAVCKLWRSLITDPSFSLRFISHHRSRYQPAAVFLPSHKPHSILSFLPMPDEARPDLRAFDCFKDLLLCGFADLFGELGRSYLVCNPFTKQWVALPLAPRKPKGGHYGSAKSANPWLNNLVVRGRPTDQQQQHYTPSVAFKGSRRWRKVACDLRVVKLKLSH